MPATRSFRLIVIAMAFISAVVNGGCDPQPTGLPDGKCGEVATAKSDTPGTLVFEGTFEPGLHVGLKIRRNGSAEMYNGSNDNAQGQLQFTGMPSGTFPVEQVIISGCEGEITGMPDQVTIK